MEVLTVGENFRIKRNTGTVLPGGEVANIEVGSSSSLESDMQWRCVALTRTMELNNVAPICYLEFGLIASKHDSKFEMVLTVYC
jgi:hypothetical protein